MQRLRRGTGEGLEGQGEWLRKDRGRGQEVQDEGRGRVWGRGHRSCQAVRLWATWAHLGP